RDVDVHAIPMLRLLPEVARARGVLVDLPLLRRYDIEDGAHLVTAAAGQPRIERRREGERRVVRETESAVLRRIPIAEPTPEVAGGHGDAGRELLRGSRCELPIVRALPPAVDVVVVPGPGNGVRPKVPIRHGAA